MRASTAEAAGTAVLEVLHETGHWFCRVERQADGGDVRVKLAGVEW